MKSLNSSAFLLLRLTYILFQGIVVAGGSYDNKEKTDKVHLLNLDQGIWISVQSRSPKIDLDLTRSVVSNRPDLGRLFDLKSTFSITALNRHFDGKRCFHVHLSTYSNRHAL